MTLKQKYELLRSLVEEIQKRTYHEPDSDYYERCNGCHRSPYNVPPHTDNCLVPKIAGVLEQTTLSPKKKNTDA